MSENQAQILIDGKAFSFVNSGPEKETRKLLQFALDQGVDIPYFCYHEGMSIPTNCRMCLVEIGNPVIDRATGQPVLDENGQPSISFVHKPLTSCNLDLSPGMVVKTEATSPKIKKAQAGVLEFMLVNHPLDCPICDQAGECPLQINTYKYGPEGSRFEVEKVHKPKRIELGANVVLDAERCINCTRCTRFTEEISKTDQLTIISRGDKNHPAVAPGKTFDDPYSMNVIDLCPVGALTSSSFRFKARVWEMNYTPSLCTECSRGCSVDVWIKDNQVLRQTPKENRKINDWWMCDEGRLAIEKFNVLRTSGIKLKGDIPVPFEDGLQRAAQMLLQVKDRNKVLFVASPFASLESNYALKQFAKEFNGSTPVYTQHIEESFKDNFLRQADRSPNQQSCELLGFTPISTENLSKELGQYELVYFLENDRLLQSLDQNLGSTQVIAHATQQHSALEYCTLVLPAATHIEAAGTFINFQGIAQITRQAKEIRQMSPEMWMSMSKSRSDKAAVLMDNWKHAENILDCLPGYLLISKIAGKMGIEGIADSHKVVLGQLKELYPDVLSHISVSRFVPMEAFKMNPMEFSIK
ncbi:MAG: (2Fe-2S)-binding protein [Sphingobacteriia bacterium]|nr:(2Fe-2S)-binding protein [Sphingobacteriia bacterium]